MLNLGLIRMIVGIIVAFLAGLCLVSVPRFNGESCRGAVMQLPLPDLIDLLFNFNFPFI